MTDTEAEERAMVSSAPTLLASVLPVPMVRLPGLPTEIDREPTVEISESSRDSDVTTDMVRESQILVEHDIETQVLPETQRAADLSMDPVVEIHVATPTPGPAAGRSDDRPTDSPTDWRADRPSESQRRSQLAASRKCETIADSRRTGAHKGSANTGTDDEYSPSSESHLFRDRPAFNLQLVVVVGLVLLILVSAGAFFLGGRLAVQPNTPAQTVQPSR